MHATVGGWVNPSVFNFLKENLFPTSIAGCPVGQSREAEELLAKCEKRGRLRKLQRGEGGGGVQFLQEEKVYAN